MTDSADSNATNTKKKLPWYAMVTIFFGVITPLTIGVFIATGIIGWITMPHAEIPEGQPIRYAATHRIITNPPYRLSDQVWISTNKRDHKPLTEYIHADVLRHGGKLTQPGRNTNTYLVSSEYVRRLRPIIEPAPSHQTSAYQQWVNLPQDPTATNLENDTAITIGVHPTLVHRKSFAIAFITQAIVLGFSIIALIFSGVITLGMSDEQDRHSAA